MADLLAEESAIFKELITLINTEVIDKYKGTVTEQTLGTMVIGLTTAALDKAFQKPLLDKDLELKEAQKPLIDKDVELKTAQKALIDSQKAQYDSYLRVKQAEFLANIGLGGASGGVDPGGAFMTAVLYSIFSLNEYPQDIKQKIEDYLSGGTTP